MTFKVDFFLFFAPPIPFIPSSSPLRLLRSQWQVPALVCVSEADSIVPAQNVKQVFGSWQARLRGVRVLELRGAGHGGWLGDADLRARLANGVVGLAREARLIAKVRTAIPYYGTVRGARPRRPALSTKCVPQYLTMAQ